MSHSIKLSQPVYDMLRVFQGKRESFSEAVERLLTLIEKVGELKDILEGQVSYAKWKAEQLEKIKPLPDAIGTDLSGKPLIERPRKE